MINHYTANRKVRNDDAYSPGGRIGLRPDRARWPTASGAARRTPACRSSPAASRRRCAGSRTTTTGATRSAARSCSTARPTCSSSAWASAAIVEIARRLAAGADGARPARHARRGLSPGRRARRRRPNDTIDAAQLRRSRAPTSWAFAEMTQDLAQRDEPATTPGGWCSITTARRRRQPAGAAAVARRRWTASTACRYTRRPHPSYGQSRFPPSRWSRTRCRSCAAASAAARSARSRRTRGGSSRARSQESVLGEIRQMARRSRVQGRRQRHRRPDGQHVPDALHAARGRGRVPPAVVRASRRSASCWAPITARSIELMQRGPRRAGRQEGARRLRHPHGPGPPLARVHARAGRASRRRASEGRARAHRSRRARR